MRLSARPWIGTLPLMIRINVPNMGKEEIEAVASVLESGYMTQGPKATEFENAIGNYISGSPGIATSSATTALHLILETLGIGPGDEVIIPDFTFPATGNAIVQSGATPVIIDVNPDTFNLNPQNLEQAISPRTKAIIPVHVFGLCADIDAIRNVVAKFHPIFIIEDAACALGSKYFGRSAGTLGDFACFSFHPRKVITTGEGGMLMFQNNEFKSRARQLSTHGGGKTSQTDPYLLFSTNGFNYRLSDINAAIGIEQLKKINRILNSKFKLAQFYIERLRNNEDISFQVVPEGYVHNFQSFVIKIRHGIDRDWVIRQLFEFGIESTLGTYSLSLQPSFQKWVSFATPVGQSLHHSTLTLPLFEGLTFENIEYICNKLESILRNNSAPLNR